MEVLPSTQQKPHFFKMRGTNLQKKICVKNLHKSEILKVTRLKALQLISTGNYTYTNKAKLRSFLVRKRLYLIRKEQMLLRKKKIEDEKKKQTLKKNKDVSSSNNPKGSL